jgi:hypothetical protein
LSEGLTNFLLGQQKVVLSSFRANAGGWLLARNRDFCLWEGFRFSVIRCNWHWHCGLLYNANATALHCFSVIGCSAFVRHEAIQQD